MRRVRAESPRGCRGVQLVVHEQNSVPGVTNRTLSHIAKKVLCGFDGALAHGEWVGNPVRSEIAALPQPRAAFRRTQRSDSPARARRQPGRVGHQHDVAAGVARDDAASAGSPSMRREASRQDERRLTRTPASKREVDAFIDDMAAAYAWADVVVCRAGALTLAELVRGRIGVDPRAVSGSGRRSPDAQCAGARRVRRREARRRRRRFRRRVWLRR